MKTTDPGDAARIELLLAELRLPAIKLVWASLAAQADKEGWPAGRFLAALAEHEIAERSRPHGSSPWAEDPRLERRLAEARLPAGKTLDSFDLEAVPVISKAQVMALAAGDAWLINGANLLRFGPPGGGQEPPCGSSQLRSRREWLARAVHPHHRSRPAAANCASRARARSRYCQARQIPPPDPR